MATFSQWRNAADRGDVKRVTWVCGAERVLVEEVVDHVRQTVGAGDFDRVSLTAGEVPEREVWAAVNQCPSDPRAARLVVVRAAEKLKRWNALADWVDAYRELPNTKLLLVSGEADYDVELAHVALVRDRGHLVRCSTPNETDCVAWVRRHAPCLDPTDARYLLARVGGDLRRAKNVCLKLRAFEAASAGRDVVDALTAESPGEDLVDALVALRKAEALRALEALHVREYSRVVGVLDSRLDDVVKVAEAARRKVPAKEVKGVPIFRAIQLYPVVRHYDRGRVDAARAAIAVVDDAVQAGAREGTLESLICLW